MDLTGDMISLFCNIFRFTCLQNGTSQVALLSILFKEPGQWLMHLSGGCRSLEGGYLLKAMLKKLLLKMIKP